MAGQRGHGRVFKRGKKFWIAYSAPVHGRSAEIREPAGYVEKDARELLVSRLLEVQAHRRGLIRFAPGRHKATIVSLVGQVIEDMKLRGKASARTAACQAKHIEEFFGSTRAATITPETISEYVTRRREAGAA